MGIKGLSKLLAEHAPGCSMERKFQSYLDRKIAIDASMHIYQYLVSKTIKIQRKNEDFFEFKKFSKNLLLFVFYRRARRSLRIARSRSTPDAFLLFFLFTFTDGCRSLWGESTDR